LIYVNESARSNNIANKAIQMSISEESLIEFTKSFELEVSKNSLVIDPESELDWGSLTVGWALAKGMTSDQAHIFSSFIRYYTDLG
jgi:hypothetical protein